MKILWEEIDFVLLDLDGTLLDKHFDDYFWEEHIPEQYAKLMQISIKDAKTEIYAAYKVQEGKLVWTDIDYWSNRFNMDIPALKESVSHLVAVHEGVFPFLEFLQCAGKRVAVLTNAHAKAVEIKLTKIPLRPYLQKIVSANEVGFPKEVCGYWEAAEKIVGFKKERSLFVDDNEEVLMMAKLFGIKHLVYKSYASSQIDRRDSNRFVSIRHFSEIVPPIQSRNEDVPRSLIKI
ncbi:MAG: HAD hydrolase-like protein [Nitrospirae bacterium]|nr:HAD hydrolase-like protein [Candidatus Troglogloeales bacterium]MBI3598595.1 HAD hydrolase-like protein [Candidatus Troglogloeales bacterium]